MGKKIRVRTLAAMISCSAAMAMCLGAGVGDAADPPAVTGQANSVTSTSAQLNGTIHPGNIDTFWAFQYGPSNSYGQNTTPVGPLTGTTANSVSTEVTGLQPNTTYHFRLIAVQGAAGTSGESDGYTGADETFTTSSSGSSITTSSGGKHAKATLRSRTLHVSHGATEIPWGCSGSAGATCKLKISITARGKIAGKTENVSCGHGTFSAKTGKRNSVRVVLGSKCAQLVTAASRQRLSATLKAAASTGSGSLKAKVTLVG